jgi:acetyltransferase
MKAFLNFGLPLWLRRLLTGAVAIAAGPRRAGACLMRPYPSELGEIVTTSDGQRLLLRPVRPEDEEAFRANFSKFSPEAVRRRFFRSMRSLTQAEAARLTHFDREREMALVLTDPVPPESGPPEGYGVVRIVIDPGRRFAEFALIIRDDMAGKGLGTLLMQRLIAYARRRGVQELVGDVQPDNHRMLALCRSLGFKIEPRHKGSDPVRVSLGLADAVEAGSGTR